MLDGPKNFLILHVELVQFQSYAQLLRIMPKNHNTIFEIDRVILTLLI